MQRRRQACPGGLVQTVASRSEDLIDPTAAPPRPLIARLRVERQAQGGAQPVLVVQGELAGLAGDRGGHLLGAGRRAAGRREAVRGATGERALGPAAIEALSWSPTTAGVPWARLRPDQQEILTALLVCRT